MIDSFTSLPPEQEQTFLVYEERMQAISKTANNVGWGVSIVLFVVTMLIVFSHPAPKHEAPPEEGAAPTEPAH